MLSSVCSCLGRRAIIVHNGPLPSALPSVSRSSCAATLAAHFSASARRSVYPEGPVRGGDKKTAAKLLAEWAKKKPADVVTETDDHSLNDDLLPRIQSAPKSSSLPFVSKEYMEHLQDHFEKLAARRSVPPELSSETERKQELWVDELDDIGHLHGIHPYAFSGSKKTLYAKARIGDRLMPNQRARDAQLDKPTIASANLRRCFELVDALTDLNRSYTRGNWSHRIIFIYVPETTLVKLFGSEAGNNNIHLNVFSGCHIQVLSRVHTNARGWRKVLLKGSHHPVKAASKELSDAISEDVGIGPLPAIGPPGKPTASPIRSVWARLRNGDEEQGLLTAPPLTRVQRPNVWSVKTLLFYIQDLVWTKQPRYKIRQYYPSEDAYFNAVGDTIRDLIKDHSVHSMLSSETISLIMSFMIKHRQLAKLHEMLPMFDKLMSTRAFNELFRAAARRSDLWLFGIYVQLMKEAGLKPNGWEWVQFLKCISSHRLRAYMFMYAYELGAFKEPHILRAALPYSLQHNFTFVLSTGGNVPEYLQSLQKLFGNWLSGNAVHALMLVASWGLNPEAIAAIMDYCKTREGRLDDKTLSAALLYFSITKRFKDGIRFFVDFTRVHRVQRTANITRILFHLAWRRRAYNTCRLLWRYACLEGHVSGDMESKMRDSIEGPEYDYETLGSIFFSRIGKVVTGVDTDVLSYSLLGDEEPVFVNEDGLGYKALEKYDPKSKKGQKCAQQLIDNDLRSGEVYEPFTTLEDLILQASELDVKWGRVEQSADWIAQNAIRVPVIRRNQWEHYCRTKRNSGEFGAGAGYTTKS